MLTKTTCDRLTDALGDVADGTVVLSDDERSHVETCLRCQADLVQHRKLLRAMQSLRTQVIEPTPGLLADILAGLSETGEERAIRSLLTGKRIAYVGGIAAATAAGAAGALLARSRRFRVAS